MTAWTAATASAATRPPARNAEVGVLAGLCRRLRNPRPPLPRTAGEASPAYFRDLGSSSTSSNNSTSTSKKEDRNGREAAE